MKLICAALLLAASAAHAEDAACRPGDTNLTATLWLKTAAERDAAAHQAYAVATRAMQEAAAEERRLPRRKRRPLAVILDLDETALDNVGFQIRMAAQGLTFSKGEWVAWAQDGDPGAIPGAVEFLAAAVGAKVTPFFITNREASTDPAKDEAAGTLADLRSLKFPLLVRPEWDGDNVLFSNERPDWSSDKVSRRAWVEGRFRVVAVIGDDLNDFAPAKTIVPADRKTLVADHRAKWGREWFILPNPIYGSWSDTLLGETIRRPEETLKDAVSRTRSLTPCDELALRRRALPQPAASATAASSSAD